MFYTMCMKCGEQWALGDERSCKCKPKTEAMTREDIINMAAQAGIDETVWVFNDEAIERFAALVAAAEREACAELADKCIEDSYRVKPQNKEEANDLKVMRILSEEFAIAIRARGET